MPARHVVVDGSNIATEGRSLPSLVQLDVAVREYRREFADDVITVVVDATFGHRIDASERANFDEAVAHNEIVSPPAGAIGRGDAFLLRVAEKVGATVLSNDSFQEFHGEHDWLFNNGRLIGGKPVPGVGWIFTPRTPVRGPKSRDSMRDARREKPPRKEEIKKVQKAIAVATEEAVEPDSPKVKRRRRGRGLAPPAEPVNDPLPFIEFVATHPLGGVVEAQVESFSSHGAFVTCDGLRCYIPLSGLADPAPRAAKEVLTKGETRQFVLQALDPPRRGIELALPDFAHVSGVPTDETVEQEIREGAGRRPSRHKRGGRGRSGVDDLTMPSADSADTPKAASGAEPPAPKGAKPARGKRAAAAAAVAAELDMAAPSGPKKRPARPRAGAPRAEPASAPAPLAPPPPAAKRAPRRVAAPPAEIVAAPAAKAVAKKAPAKRAAAAPTAAVAKKVTAPGKAAATKVASVRKVATATKAAPVKKATPAKRAVPATEKVMTAKKAAPAKGATPAKRAAPATNKVATAKKVPATKKVAATKKAAPATKAAPSKKVAKRA